MVTIRAAGSARVVTKGKKMKTFNFWDILKSRKFWALVLAVVTAAGLLATGEVTGWQFLQAVIAAVAAYSTGVAIEDAGLKAGSKNG